MSINVLYLIHEFEYIEPTSHSLDETDLAMAYDNLYVLLNTILQNFIDFCL